MLRFDKVKIAAKKEFYGAKKTNKNLGCWCWQYSYIKINWNIE